MPLGHLVYFIHLCLCSSFIKFSYKSSLNSQRVKNSIFIACISFLFIMSNFCHLSLCLACLQSRMVPWPSPQVCLTFRPLTEDQKLSWGNMKHPRLNEILSENSKALFISTNSGEYKKHGAFSFPTQERKSFKMPSMIGQHNQPLLADIKNFIHT